jgi:hypothetical protein
MAALANAASEFFAWKFSHPHESEDPSAVWGAAWRAGARAALRDTSQLSDMTPLLRELLCLVEDGRVEDVLRATDRRPRPAYEDEDPCTVAF